MAIKELSISPTPTAEEPPKKHYEINNGDLEALNTVVDKWNFKNIESALRFAVAVLVKSADSKEINYTDTNKNDIALVPGDSLLKEQQSEPPEAPKIEDTPPSV